MEQVQGAPVMRRGARPSCTGPCGRGRRTSRGCAGAGSRAGSWGCWNSPPRAGARNAAPICAGSPPRRTPPPWCGPGWGPRNGRCSMSPPTARRGCPSCSATWATTTGRAASTPGRPSSRDVTWRRSDRSSRAWPGRSPTRTTGIASSGGTTGCGTTSAASSRAADSNPGGGSPATGGRRPCPRACPFCSATAATRCPGSGRSPSPCWGRPRIRNISACSRPPQATLTRTRARRPL